MNFRPPIDSLLRAGRRVVRRCALLGVLPCSFAGFATASEPVVTAPPAASVQSHQDLLFLGRARMLVLRMVIEVDGRPFGDVWQESIRERFTAADLNGDGILSAEELHAERGSNEASRESELVAILTSPGLMQADTDPPDGGLSLQEFSAFAAARRGGAFQAPETALRVGSTATTGMAAGESQGPGSVLFKTLDQDGNGRISLAELREGPQSLQKLDFDGDGASSVDELDHLRSPFQPAPNSSNSPNLVPILALPADGPPRDVLQAVLSEYGRKENGRITSVPASALGIPKEMWSLYDEDGDELLDRRELKEFLTRPTPHVELLVRLGTSPEGSIAIESRETPAGKDLVVKASGSGFVSLILDGVQLEISANPKPVSAESLTASFTQRFKAVDADGNGYIDRAESQRNRLFVESFESFDPDGDEKIFEEELMGILKPRIATALSRTRMTAVDRGQDLFEILDANRDRRLTQREVLGAAPRFGLWDLDNDEKLSQGEIPRIHQIVFDRGSPDIPGLTMPSSVNRPAGDAAMARSGPGWFLKMDRNEDGDVSRAEFLGKIPQFESLDRDSDGLIDASEAEQFNP